MKREEVKNKIPGITDEQLDWLMGENGRDRRKDQSRQPADPGKRADHPAEHRQRRSESL